MHSVCVVCVCVFVCWVFLVLVLMFVTITTIGISDNQTRKRHDTAMVFCVPFGVGWKEQLDSSRWTGSV